MTTKISKPLQSLLDLSKQDDPNRISFRITLTCGMTADMRHVLFSSTDDGVTGVTPNCTKEILSSPAALSALAACLIMMAHQRAIEGESEFEDAASSSQCLSTVLDYMGDLLEPMISDEPIDMSHVSGMEN